MHFSEIELYNFGIYKGRHNIELIDQRKKKNITLVGGMNGRGKTTILDAIFLCLYGRKSIEYIVGKKEAYNKVLKDRINKSADDKTTHVKITMVMDDDEGTIISITRTWSQTDSKITTDLIVEKNGIEDTYLSENWEYYVEELIPYGIAKFFFFDNEKISQIADDDAFDKIKDSIKSVMGVTTVETLCSHIEKIRKDKNASLKKSSTTTLTKESEELSTAIEECETKIRNLYAQRAALFPELEKTTNKLEETEQSFWKKGGNLGLNHDDIIRDQHELKDKESALKEQAIALASNPAMISILDISFFKNIIYKLFIRHIVSFAYRNKYNYLFHRQIHPKLRQELNRYSVIIKIIYFGFYIVYASKAGKIKRSHICKHTATSSTAIYCISNNTIKNRISRCVKQQILSFDCRRTVKCSQYPTLFSYNRRIIV